MSNNRTTNDSTTNRNAAEAQEAGSRSRWTPIACAALAIAAAAGIGGFVAGSTQPANAAPSGAPATLAQYAAEHNLTGLSPASLTSVEATGETESLADFARRNNLTGLSPASLGPAPTE